MKRKPISLKSLYVYMEEFALRNKNDTEELLKKRNEEFKVIMEFLTFIWKNPK